MAVQKVPVLSDDMIRAIHIKRGVVKHAAAYLGCDDATIFTRARHDPLVQDAIVEARAARAAPDLDDDVVLSSKARQVFHHLLGENNVTAAIFIAKTKGGFEGDGFNAGSKVTLRIDNS